MQMMCNFDIAADKIELMKLWIFPTPAFMFASYQSDNIVIWKFAYHETQTCNESAESTKSLLLFWNPLNERTNERVNEWMNESNVCIYLP